MSQNKSVEELRQRIIDEMESRRIDHKTYIDADWLLKEYETALRQTSQERELDILEIHLNRQMAGYTNVSLASIYNYIDQRREALTNPNKD